VQTKIRFRLAALQIALTLPLVWTVAGGTRAFADDEPTIAKDSILVNAWTISQYHGSYDNWSWVPRIKFQVNGPIASGSQLYVEFTLPGKGSWVKFDCQTGNIEKDHWWKTECGGRDIPEDKGITSIGAFDFAIGMRNELAGTDSKLFTGKIKVAKAHTNEVGPKAANKWVYYVDEDWTLPIGYVFLTPSDVQGWKYPKFNVAFWVRGETALLEPHLFYQGKEVGKKFYGGDEVGKSGCNEELQTETTQSVEEKTPQKAKWERLVCTFNNVIGWDKTGKGPGMFGPPFLLSANPGDYEFKALWKGHLARSIKFTVGPEAKFDNGIATSNKLGSDRVIVPVQVLGDQDGSWNKTAWKTDAFYGNPLTGFTAAQ
jgi:hypothetical protein